MTIESFNAGQKILRDIQCVRYTLNKIRLLRNIDISLKDICGDITLQKVACKDEILDVLENHYTGELQKLEEEFARL